jgi:hypothetical protein
MDERDDAGGISVPSKLVHFARRSIFGGRTI